MKIVRSILGVVVGIAVAMVAIMAIESISGLIYPPPPELEAEMRLAMEGKPMNRDKVIDLMHTMPIGAFLIVLLSWEAGALVGGAAAAAIARRARPVHAGIVGVAVLAPTIATAAMLPGHPDWMVIAGLLLPIPVSLLGGKLGSMVFPASNPAPAESHS